VNLNVGGAYNQEDGKGAIYRNCDLELCRTDPSHILVSCSEMCGGRRGRAISLLLRLKLVAEWIPMAVEVETDCATILGRLTTKGARSRWTFLFRATKKVMAFLQEVCLLHCERECNRIAHEFAQLGKRSAQSTDYFSPFAVNNMQNLLL
jgi:hypothetical protein